jgi:Na+-driven multidrug efflux pump
LAYYLAHIAGYNEKGVYLSIIAGDLLLTALALILFKQGRWKTAQV